MEKAKIENMKEEIKVLKKERKKTKKLINDFNQTVEKELIVFPKVLFSIVLLIFLGIGIASIIYYSLNDKNRWADFYLAVGIIFIFITLSIFFLVFFYPGSLSPPRYGRFGNSSDNTHQRALMGEFGGVGGFGGFGGLGVDGSII